MNRREILQYTAWLTGGAVSAPLAGALLSGCSKPETGSAAAGAVLHHFPPAQFDVLASLADTLLPRTDSPSATEVDVHTTMDSMVGLVYEPEAKRQFQAGWEALLGHLQNHGFGEKAPTERADLLRNLELSEEPALDEARRGLMDVKQQVVAYYLTTEEIGENHLNYLPIPGKYEPCISLDEVDNTAWAI